MVYDVPLTERELAHAKLEMRLRQKTKADFGQVEAPRIGRDLETNDFEAACAELAFCKLVNRYPQAFSGQKVIDVAPSWEVRWTDEHQKSLIVRPGDDDESNFVHVTGTGGEYKVQGFMRGREAKANDDYKKAPNGRPPAWFVPGRDLIDVCMGIAWEAGVGA